jgi:hypothetical protein
MEPGNGMMHLHLQQADCTAANAHTREAELPSKLGEYVRTVLPQLHTVRANQAAKRLLLHHALVSYYCTTEQENNIQVNKVL